VLMSVVRLLFMHTVINVMVYRAFFVFWSMGGLSMPNQFDGEAHRIKALDVRRRKTSRASQPV
jgi:hypothetical protein